jgi:hypothetical protein
MSSEDNEHERSQAAALQEAKAPKKLYVPPVLRRLGTVRELTLTHPSIPGNM